MSRDDLVHTFTHTVRGGEKQQTEGDYLREVDNASIKDARSSRFRTRLTVDTPNSTAVLWPCGCVAAIKETEVDARQWMADTPGTLVGAYAVFDGPVLTVYRRDDDTVLPMPGRPSSVDCDLHAAPFDRWKARQEDVA